MATRLLCRYRCLPPPTSAGFTPVRSKHDQRNSWLMNYTMEELFFSAKGGAPSFKTIRRTGGGGDSTMVRGAECMKQDDLLVYHDNIANKPTRYALPGFNVPEDLVKYPTLLADEQVDEVTSLLQPNIQAELKAPVFDINNEDDLRRWKWFNRFHTQVMPSARNARQRAAFNSLPMFYPGSKPVEPVKNMRIAKGGGFTGGVRAGQVVGVPESKFLDEEIAADFQSVLIDVRRVSHGKTIGRKRGVRCIVVVGNGNGLVGYDIATSKDIRAAARKARNSAIHKLVYVDLADNHTIYRNMDVKKGRTRMMFHRVRPGFGVRCHRVARVICSLAGVRDVHAKLQGSTTALSVLNCTFKALTGQLNNQEFADKAKKHLLELRPEYDMRPVVVASPKTAMKTPSPLLRMTKVPYTGIVPLPTEASLSEWFRHMDMMDPYNAKLTKEIWDKYTTEEKEVIL